MTCLLEQYLYGSQPHASILNLDPALATSCSWVVELYIFDYLLLRCDSCDFLVWLTVLVGCTRKILLLDFSTGTICNIHWWCICRITNLSVTRFYSWEFHNIYENHPRHSSFIIIRAAPLSETTEDVNRVGLCSLFMEEPLKCRIYRVIKDCGCTWGAELKFQEVANFESQLI